MRYKMTDIDGLQNLQPSCIIEKSNTDTFDLSVKNPNAKKEAPLREPPLE